MHLEKRPFLEILTGGNAAPGSVPHLSVGIISADMMRLGEQVAQLESCGVNIAHFDCMDGRFAPMLTVGPPFVASVKTTMLKDVHLMVEDPLPLLAECAAAGADIITVHVESCRHPHRALQAVGELENKNHSGRPIVRGVALNPSTPLEHLEPFLDLADFILLVAVNPGFPGQRFIDSTPQRMEKLLDMTRRTGRTVLTGIDGGVTGENIGTVAALGPDIIVTGSAVFKGGDIGGNLDTIRRSMDTTVKIIV